MQEEIQAAQRIIDLIINFFVNYSLQVVGAIIVLVVGLILARWVASFLLKFFGKKEFDITLSKFISGLAKATIIVFAVIIALGKFGITVAPFVAALAAMAFGASYGFRCKFRDPRPSCQLRGRPGDHRNPALCGGKYHQR